MEDKKRLEKTGEVCNVSGVWETISVWRKKVRLVNVLVDGSR